MEQGIKKGVYTNRWTEKDESDIFVLISMFFLFVGAVILHKEAQFTFLFHIALTNLQQCLVKTLFNWKVNQKLIS